MDCLAAQGWQGCGWAFLPVLILPASDSLAVHFQTIGSSHNHIKGREMRMVLRTVFSFVKEEDLCQDPPRFLLFMSYCLEFIHISISYLQGKPGNATIARKSSGERAVGRQLQHWPCVIRKYITTRWKSVGLILHESDLGYKIWLVHGHKFDGLRKRDLLSHNLCGSEVWAQLSQSPLLRFQEAEVKVWTRAASSSSVQGPIPSSWDFGRTPLCVCVCVCVCVFCGCGC